ncbi:hypothetical protein CEB3_c14470 [Peptococcaceae bacterium CEB3]|nr:hypothetical protein CEB3_c14470 [Peptococcaceae bacterium CEB3]
MKKTAKMLSVAGGSVVLVIGLMALPALASGSAPAGASGSGWFSQMRTFMGQGFTPAQHQQLMNSGAMQKLHNSAAMQQAMQTGNISQMEALMNSDPALKAQVGQSTINRMDQFMNGVKPAAATQMPVGGRTSIQAPASAQPSVRPASGAMSPAVGPSVTQSSYRGRPGQMMGGRSLGEGGSMMGSSVYGMNR